MHVNVRIFTEEILFFLRDALFSEENPETWNSRIRIFDAFEAMYEKIKYTPDAFLLLEMTVIKLLSDYSASTVETLSSPPVRSILTPSPKDEKKTFNRDHPAPQK